MCEKVNEPVGLHHRPLATASLGRGATARVGWTRATRIRRGERPGTAMVRSDQYHVRKPLSRFFSKKIWLTARIGAKNARFREIFCRRPPECDQGATGRHRPAGKMATHVGPDHRDGRLHVGPYLRDGQNHLGADLRDARLQPSTSPLPNRPRRCRATCAGYSRLGDAGPRVSSAAVGICCFMLLINVRIN